MVSAKGLIIPKPGYECLINEYILPIFVGLTMRII